MLQLGNERACLIGMRGGWNADARLRDDVRLRPGLMAFRMGVHAGRLSSGWCHAEGPAASVLLGRDQAGRVQYAFRRKFGVT